jgi:hypothetical protein
VVVLCKKQADLVMLMVSNGTNKWENRGDKEVLIDRRTMAIGCLLQTLGGKKKKEKR